MVSPGGRVRVDGQPGRGDRGGGRQGPHPLLRLRPRLTRTREAPVAAALRRDYGPDRRHVRRRESRRAPGGGAAGAGIWEPPPCAVLGSWVAAATVREVATTWA